MAKDENMIESNMINFENLSTVWNNKKNKPRGRVGVGGSQVSRGPGHRRMIEVCWFLLSG